MVLVAVHNKITLHEYLVRLVGHFQYSTAVTISRVAIGVGRRVLDTVVSLDNQGAAVYIQCTARVDQITTHY